MRKLLALTLLPATLLTGCPFACGGYNGGGDRMFRRAGDALLLCENGGYVAMLASGNLEGRYVEHLPTGDATLGTTGARAFQLAFADDGTMTTDGFGDGAWTEDTLSQVDLDHADVQCTDLETRAWWPTSATALPVATAFSKPPDAYASVDDCRAAQSRGEVPADSLCEDQVLLCPDGTILMNTGAVIASGTYTDDAGLLSVQPLDNNAFTAFSGIFAMSGSLTTGGAQGATGAFVWHTIPSDSVANGLSCQ